MDLSIIIPCYNLEKWIKPCIDSLNNQENKLNIKREIIFILDNCTDNTEEIILNNIKNWDYKIIKATEGSPGGARNVGLDNSKAKYIWFIDGDDWLTCNNAIDTVFESITKDDMDIVEFKIKSKANPDGVFGGGTVWRAMLSRRIIGDKKFNNRQNGEDNDFSWDIWNDPKARYKKIDFAPYFYNYPRKDSQSDKAYHLIGDDDV